MNIEQRLVITLLKLTERGSVSQETINMDAKIPSVTCRKLLRKMQNEGLVYFKRGIVEVDNSCRLKLATRAVNLGADVEHVASFLKWQEFEDMTTRALERNGYFVKKNLRFRYAGRRWEIDIVGWKRPLVVCMDCKHWRHGLYPSAIRRIVEAQVERTRNLADFLPSPKQMTECTSWEQTKFIPAILSLTLSNFKFYDNVPIVPVLQLQDFLSQLPAYIDALKHFTKI
jgi:Holliday junction resolvase-like predicted endonuclease